MTDVVNAYLGQAREFVQIGGPPTLALIDDLLPDVVSVRWLDVQDHEAINQAAGDAGAVLALDLTPEGELDDALVEVLTKRPPGARTVLLAAQPVSRLPIQHLAEQLSNAGQRTVHVVVVDLDGHTTRRSVVGIVAAGNELFTAKDNHRVLDSAVAAVDDAQGPADSSGELDALKSVVVTVAERAAVETHAHHVAAAELIRLRAELLSLRAELAASHRQLRAVRSSAAMQIGRGLVDVVRQPKTGLVRLPGRLRAASRSRGPSGAVGPVAPAQGAIPVPALVAGATSTGRVLPVPSGRRRTFPMTLPVCDSTVPSSHASKTPATLVDIDVPYPFFIPLRLQRDGLAGYEPETLAWWLALCDMAGPGEVWDIGANTGLFAMLTRALTDRDVVAFEPTPDLAAWARRLGFVNDLTFPVEQLALADADGTATFFLSDSTDSSSSLAEGFRESSHQLQVLTERLDSFALRRGRAPAVIKIDVETTEPAVLRGGLETIGEHRPWILCEVLAGCGVEEPVMELTRPLGYSWYHLTEEMPPKRVDEIVGDPDFEYFMYLLAPREIDEDLIDRARGWRSGLARCLPLTSPT